MAMSRISRYRGDGRAHFHHEHHRVLDDGDRIQLDERLLDRAPQNRRIEQRTRVRQLLGNQFGRVLAGNRSVGGAGTGMFSSTVGHG